MTFTPQRRGIAPLIEAARPPPGADPVFVVGVTGAVAAGKSTLAEGLAEGLASLDLRVQVVGTDGFLLPLAVLEARGLVARKGFPETYDTEALRGALASARRGPTHFPAYSHVTFDVEPQGGPLVDRPDVLIVEGLGLDPAPGGPLVDRLIYLDADEGDLRVWFRDRFVRLWRAAADDPTSFYARFLSLDEAGVRALATRVWELVNLPNLRDHIKPIRDRADLVARKSSDHGMETILWRRNPGEAVNQT